MRDRRLSFAVLIGLAALIAARAGAASACLPPPPDWVPPTDEERVRSAAAWASDIVYGEIVRGGMSGGTARFRIIHVHKGRLRPGMTIRARLGWGLDPPICAGMIGPPPPVPPGTRGTIVFQSDQRELNFLSDRELELMIAGGFIQPRPTRARGAPR
jgi:hypothetical protein